MRPVNASYGDESKIKHNKYNKLYEENINKMRKEQRKNENEKDYWSDISK